MTQPEFAALSSTFVALMTAYLKEVRASAALLAAMTAKPLPFRRRFTILRQQVTENIALEAYVNAKRSLYQVALAGFETVPVRPPL